MALDKQIRASSRRLHATLFGALVLSLGACGGGGGSSGGQSGVVGQELPKPGGGTFFVDPNDSGGSTRLRLAEITWGRLVDVHDVDALGVMNPVPAFRDFVINEVVETDGVNYRLETNSITQRSRLVILRTKGAPSSSGTFESLLETAASGMPVVAPRDDMGSGPFSIVARNACLVLRFDDCLDDDAQAEAALGETVRVLTGYPPSTPFAARIAFDQNHGGLVGGDFHATRVLVDMTVSEADAALTSLPVNAVGLPPSVATSGNANVSIRIPTLVDFASGQFQVLTTLRGIPVATSGNGPVDPTSPTFDVVRGMQSGNENQPFNGFLRDEERPEVIGGWEATFSTPAGPPAFAFNLTMQYSTACASELDVGDVLQIGGFFLEVTAPTGPAVAGIYSVAATVVSPSPIDPANLQGTGLVLTKYDPLLQLDNGCWVDFTPKPLTPPLTAVSTSAQVLVRFSEPMDPATVSAFDTFVIGRGAGTGTLPTAPNTVIGEIISSPDLKSFAFVPALPFAHTQGMTETYHVRLFLPRDLAGNLLVLQLPSVDFTIDANETTVTNSGFVMRFSATDEVDVNMFEDLRGQFFYDLVAGKLIPRFPSDLSFPVDQSLLATAAGATRTPLAAGVREPLVPQGCKLQTVWRYADFGWDVIDETNHNLDVRGISLAPRGGQVISEFYPEFEMRLSHSSRLPDEGFLSQTGTPTRTTSGLLGAPNFYTDNVLADPLSPQKTVHTRSLGYLVRPVDLFLASNGIPMLPLPLNRSGAPDSLYTWRDTAIQSKAGPDGGGIPIFFDPRKPTGGIAPAGQVPSTGLPLLMEFRCYPSSSASGLNAFDVSVATPLTIPASAVFVAPPRPNFRVYSAGGVDLTGVVVIKNPDLEVSPSGSFNPYITPSGQVSKWDGDNVSYLGQLDVVIRVSRVHTVWMNAQTTSTQFEPAVVEPDPGLQPAGTDIVIEYRGAAGFSGTAASTVPFDATMLDPYGEIETTTATANFFSGSNTWKLDPAALNGAQYIQARFTFINDIDQRLSPTLSALGIPFSTN
jgi:hypothetical protein